MSVILQFNICQSTDCTTLVFSETTGAYNAITNPTGWGAPNEDTTDATAATLTITLGDSSVHVIDLLATGNFPTTDSSIEYPIINESLGYVTGDSIPDQIITFVYSVTTTSTTYTQTIKKAFYCVTQCCVMSMFKNIDFSCDCSKQQKSEAISTYILLKGLIYSSGAGNPTQFNNILAQVNKKCINTNCNNCR